MIPQCCFKDDKEEKDELCNPWFYPTTNDFVAKSCDPWDTKDFQEHFNNLPDNECSHCLPDCTSTVFATRVSTAPFRKCDHTNLGISTMCDFNNNDMNPAIWRQEVQKEYMTLLGNLPGFIAPNSQKMSNTRKYVSSEKKLQSLTLKDSRIKNPTYDAFQNDIAIANFYFDKSTIIRFKRDHRMTLTDYISQVGGLLGLAIGVSFVSGIELLYWLVARFGSAWFKHEKENSKRHRSKTQLEAIGSNKISPMKFDVSTSNNPN